MNTLDWLASLVAFDTTSRNSNMQLISVLQEYFERHHVPIRLSIDPVENKANLLATLPAKNGSIEGGIILSGHTDVVPVDGQHWDTDPFKATQIQDRIVGRGTCDMKGFLAVILGLVPKFQEFKLQQPVHFAFSYDEEVGCRGARLLITDLCEAGIKPKACIVGEPTEMHPVVAHKGIQVFRCRIQGQAAHSSLTPKGCNAIEYAAKLMCYIRQLADQLRQEGPFDPCFDVPFTSISINQIQGGTANNIIPEGCEFIFEFRHLPHIQPQRVIDPILTYIQKELLPAMQQEQAQVDVQMDQLGAVPSFESSEQTILAQLVRTLSGKNEIRKVAYATEAGLFQGADIPTVICGPGSIEQAHRANEYVTIKQLKQCEDFLQKVIQKFCA